MLPARAWGVEHLDPAARMELILEAGADQFGGEECVELLLDLVAQGRVTEARIDESARRLLAVKFRLGLFDDPFVDEDVAARDGGAQDFRDAGYAAQARSVTVLANGSAGRAPVAAAAEGPEGLRGERVARGRRGARGRGRPPRGRRRRRWSGCPPPSSRAPTCSSSRGSTRARSTSRPGLVARLARIAAHCPLVVDVVLDRPAVLTPLLPLASALVGSYGTSDDALVDALTGAIAPEGRLPFDLPRSMEQVRRHGEDVPGYEDPLFAFGHGLGAEPRRARPPPGHRRGVPGGHHPAHPDLDPTVGSAGRAALRGLALRPHPVGGVDAGPRAQVDAGPLRRGLGLGASSGRGPRTARG